MTQPAMYEFHVSRRARDRYRFDETLFTTTGNVIFANFLAARQFAQKMNTQRDLARYPEQAVQAGQINALGLIDEILHQIFRQYRRQQPRVLQDALDWLNQNVGPDQVQATLRRFTDEFPPVAVYRREETVDEYLAGESVTPEGALLPNRQIALEEMLMLWLANQNPAFQPYQELFDDQALQAHTAYPQIMASLRQFFATQPLVGPRRLSLLDVLLSPARAYPGSLIAQLEFLGSEYAEWLHDIRLRLLSSLDMVKEENKPVFPGGGPGPAPVLEFSGAEFWDEPENFSPDLDWMPNLVLLAKNTYVWLDQLARKYQRPINRLDQVPPEELDQLRRWGVTGLWLIGLWERSPASQRIKQMRGNPEAVASAYSLFSYDIAADLGGEEAYQTLREQAWKRGIRLASDMVPNHMGIDSRWVIEHPDWFIQLDYPPFPSYTFNGPDLSWDGRVGIHLEDHYYDSTDAAVVFKRIDHWTGEARYLYHGNDGTSMPWNDTAQLNYLLPQVRETVIQTILHVARKFPIIRFDAAMTLAKRHYQRLWFPEPGTGGDIASRAEHGLTKPQFDEAFPEEFWRMVVDRVAQEAPDTLLLAEAFWLMEGYFVRTLGMHRVYNSAFMNMLRDEKNQEYRQVIKNTLEFDPQVLKRYVNFMNNPDERTAVDQFGKGDKYFGICTLLVTLPGLPMLGHGQIEGFTEKYGMEFRYPKWHEQLDADLVARHEREIFPLMRKRYLFADAANFRLYDFYQADGSVDEDVFAYSNRAGEEFALVVYQNRFATAKGWISLSAAFPEGDDKRLTQRTLGQELGLSGAPGQYVIFQEHLSRLEYLRPAAELAHQGLYWELNAYRCLVFMDFRAVQDVDGRYARLAANLGGRGVQSVEDALREMDLQPVLLPFRELVNPGMLDWLIQNRPEADTYEAMKFNLALEEADRKLKDLLAAIGGFLAAKKPDEAPAEALAETASSAPEQARPDAGGEPILAEAAASPAGRAAVVNPGLECVTEIEALQAQMLAALRSALTLSSLGREPASKAPEYRQAVKYLLAGPGGSPLAQGKPGVWGPLLSGLVVAPLGCMPEPAVVDPVARSLRWLDDWLLSKQVGKALGEMGVDKYTLTRLSLLHRLLIAQQGWLAPDKSGKVDPEAVSRRLLDCWTSDETARRYLMAHAYQDVEWFNKEAFEDLVWWTFAFAVIEGLARSGETAKDGFVKWLRSAYQAVLLLLSAQERSEYRLDRLVL